MAKGLFIVFEGCEGSGKSTQAELLQTALVESGRQAILVHEPGSTNLGRYLRNYLKSKQPLTKESELLLFEAARAQLVADEIRPVLANGLIVIADRFAASTLAYQGYGRGIDIGLISRLNDFATAGIGPDITFLLDIGPEDGLKRAATQLPLGFQEEETNHGRADVEGHRRFEDQPLTFHNRVREGYLKLAKSDSEKWMIIDAGLPRAEISKQVWQTVWDLLEKVQPLLIE